MSEALSSHVRLSLPFPPTVNNLFANSAKGGRHTTAKYTAWKALAGVSVKDTHRKGLRHYTLAIVLRRPDNRPRDIANYEKAISDLLVAHGVVKDDSYCERLTMQWDAGMTEECVVMVIPCEEALAA